MEYNVGDIVRTKKQHPCGSKLWEITRIGADIKFKCVACSRSIMLPRIEFNKKLNQVNGLNFIYRGY